MERADIKDPGGGVNQSGIRDHNARLVLSMIQRHGQLPGMEIARRAGLSPQTVSVILRLLKKEGFLLRGEPVRGRVGKPSVPMALNPDGVFSVGMKIGRRSLDLLLMDFVGTVRVQMQTTYKYPAPRAVFQFLQNGLETFKDHVGPDGYDRVAGIGIASPFQLWKWPEKIDADETAMGLWRDLSFEKEVAQFSPLPVLLENDATAACRAEHVFGQGRELQDFAYFFIGSFVGGGIALNHSVYKGRSGNAGSFGSIPSSGVEFKGTQLIDNASIFQLEDMLSSAGIDAKRLWATPQDWSGFPDQLEQWIDHTTTHLARAVIAVSAVLDFEAVIIDGGFPPDIRRRIVALVADRMAGEDSRGLILPDIKEGQVGRNARAIGAACGPVFSEYLLNPISGPF